MASWSDESRRSCCSSDHWRLNNRSKGRCAKQVFDEMKQGRGRERESVRERDVEGEGEREGEREGVRQRDGEEKGEWKDTESV